MSNLESPITLYRKRNNLTKKQLAKMVDLSATQIFRIEQGTYEKLPEALTNLTGLTNSTYQRYRDLKRRQAKLDYQLDRFISPSDFALWRKQVAWEKFLPQSRTAFANYICLNVNYLHRFETQDSGQMPPALQKALTACGVTFYEQLALDLTDNVKPVKEVNLAAF